MNSDNIFCENCLFEFSTLYDFTSVQNGRIVTWNGENQIDYLLYAANIQSKLLQTVKKTRNARD